MKLLGLVPNCYIHVSVSNLYIPPIGLHILLQENRWEYIAYRYMNVEIRTEATQILIGEYINRIFFAVYTASEN
jgi:hypothetical protein